ncbi:hypothetical protein DVH24_016661 [Malus domestica]|uniref:Uncharacterized protein n=1 Tax=Malus domestica TaxID=3750 RepID=A0A498HSS6_MALDO|nr:hypothetical protein DVH24_016661 [Malus domestica]
MIDCVFKVEQLVHYASSILQQSPNLLAFGSLGELVRALGGAVASTSLLGVPLGHNSSFLQGPTFAPPRIISISSKLLLLKTFSFEKIGCPAREVNSLKEEVTTLRGQVAAQGERMNMILQALAMSGLQIPTMPAPNVAPPSPSQPFRPDDTE